MICGFTMLPSYYEALRPLADEDRLKLYDAMMDYAFSGKEPEGLSPLLNGYFSLLRPNLDSSLRHYAAAAENGKRGGRPRKSEGENPEETQRKNPDETQRKNREKETERETEGETEKEREDPAGEPPTRRRFCPPSVDEVAAYVRQRGSKVDPQGFLDFYQSKGWIVGKTPMRDWKAACRNAESWERWERKEAAGHEPVPATAGDRGKAWNLSAVDLRGV